MKTVFVVNDISVVFELAAPVMTVANKRVRLNPDRSAGEIEVGGKFRALSTDELGFIHQELSLLARYQELTDKMEESLRAQQLENDALQAVVERQSAETAAIGEEMTACGQVPWGTPNFSAAMNRIAELGANMSAVSARYAGRIQSLQAAVQSYAPQITEVGEEQTKVAREILDAMKRHRFEGLTEEELFPKPVPTSVSFSGGSVVNGTQIIGDVVFRDGDDTFVFDNVSFNSFDMRFDF
jgi:hypothetical protein